MWVQLKRIANRLLPTVALALYSGRIASEQWAYYYQTGFLTALLLTLIMLVFTYPILRPHSLKQTWPLLLLYGYIFYPELNPTIAISVGLWSGITLLLWGHRQAPIFPNNQPAFNERSKIWIGAGLTAVSSFILYLNTLAPDILPADNGEFQWVAAQLGLAHPPGFPLYTLLAYLFTQLPLQQSPAYMVNLFSAITSSATLVLLYLTVHQLTKRHLAAVTAVFALATSTTFWAQATTANIRSLTTFFAALAILALVKFYFYTVRAKQRGLGSGQSVIGERWLGIFVGALVLGVGHHLSLFFMGLVFVFALLLIDWRFFVTPRRWLRPFLITLISLLPLLYLPLANPQLRNINSFLNHFLGLGFQGDFFYFIQPVVLEPRLKIMVNVLTFQFAPLLLVAMLIGLILLSKHHWKLALLMGGSFAIHTFITATYRAPQTVEYMLPAIIPAILCLGFAVGYTDKLFPNSPRKAQLSAGIGQLFIAAVLLTSLYQGWQHFPDYRQLQASTNTRDYTLSLLQNAPANSTILANWHWATPLWYLQDVEGMRPDVTVRYVAPASDPYEVTWATEIATELANGRSVIATNYDSAAYQTLPPAQPFGEAYLFPQTPTITLPNSYTPSNQPLNNIQLLGYQLTPTTTEIGQKSILTIAWQPNLQSPIPNPQSPIPFFAHLIGPDGRLVAQSDTNSIPQAEGISFTQFQLTPRPGALPGEYNIRLGSGDAQLDLTTLNVVPMRRPLATQNTRYRIDVENGRTLIGYDWDNTLPDQARLYLHWQTKAGYITETRDTPPNDLPTYLGPWGLPSNNWSTLQNNKPSNYIPLGQGIIWTGSPISQPIPSPQSPISTLPQTLRASTPVQRDLVVSVRLIGFQEDGYQWAWCDAVDSIPAMGAIPTLKWIANSEVTSPHQVIYTMEHPGYDAFCSSTKPAPNAPILYVDDAAYDGQTIGGTLILYDAFTERPLPILDERINAQYQWIPLGSTIIRK